MLTAPTIDRPPSTPAQGVDLPVRRLSVDEYHALLQLGVLWEGAGVELLEGLLVDKRPHLRIDDPFVDGEQWQLWRLTLDDYHRMRDADFFSDDEHCEFLEGLLIETMIRRPPHDTALGLLHDLLAKKLPAGWMIRNQSALTLTDSEPEPDLAVVRGERRDFAVRHPGPSETGLVVEVAESSLAVDRTVKLRTYAKHSISQYWIVNLMDEQIEVYSEPSGLTTHPAYAGEQVYVEGQTVPLVLADQQIALIPVSDVLP